MNKKVISSVIILLLVFRVSAQSDQIELGNKQYEFIDRLEVLLSKDSVFNMSSYKGLNRKETTQRALYIKEQSDKGKIHLSDVDKYNLDQLLMDNFEWAYPLGDTSMPIKTLFSKNAATKPFYWGTKKEDFSFFLKPIIAFEMGKENNVSYDLLRNTRGLEIRGNIGKTINYYTSLTENQEIFPLYVEQYKLKYNATPGVGYFKDYRNGGSDYFEAKGGINFRAGKYIDVQFANDKVFIGNGFRSLILSDNSDNFLFLKFRTKFWKFQYYNLFGQLVSDFKVDNNESLLPQKNMVLQYLDFQATKRTNIALFETIMFSRQNGFDINYLNPVIFLDAIQQKIGSPDKLTVGMNIKSNVAKNTQIYGQLIINEWVTHEVLHYSNGWWGNKEAVQFGVKRYNFLGVSNLDAQLECNIVRPFVYTHNDSTGSWTNYNQALAHPLGANFKEFIAIFNYQPSRRFSLNAKFFYSDQGLDSAGSNFGSNITELYTTRIRDYGFSIGSGIASKTFTASGTASYEIIPNLFINANLLIRDNKTDGQNNFNTTAFMFGFRWNIARREFYF